MNKLSFLEKTNYGDNLKKTGISRRIDDLGRIVIPKEIRKNLKIHNNDELEIVLENEHIILNKYSCLEKDVVIDNLAKAFQKVSKKDIVITSRDKIINMDNILLSNDVIDIIEKRKLYVSVNFVEMDIMGFKKVSILVNPLIINGDLLGSVIIYSEKDSIENRDIDNSNVIKYFFENYLE